jgi:hypothetical protein
VKVHHVSRNQKPIETGMNECEPAPSGPSKKIYREVETFGPSDESGSSKVGSEREIDEVATFKKPQTGGEELVDEVARFNKQPTGEQMVIDEVATFKKPQTGGEELVDEVARFNKEPSGGGSRRSKIENEEVASFRKVNCSCGKGNEMVSCPACNSEIHGMDEMDLSNNLGRHLSEAHKIKTMIAPMK